MHTFRITRHNNMTSYTINVLKHINPFAAIQSITILGTLRGNGDNYQFLSFEQKEIEIELMMNTIGCIYEYYNRRLSGTKW